MELGLSSIKSFKTKMDQFNFEMVLKYTFSWLTDKDYRGIAAAFFVTEAFALAAIALLTAGLIIFDQTGIIKNTLIFGTGTTTVTSQQLDLFGSGVTSIVPFLFVLVVLAVAILAFKLYKDKAFNSVVTKVMPIRLLFYAIPLVGGFLFLTMYYQSMPGWLNSLNNLPQNADAVTSAIALGPSYLLAMGIRTITTLAYDAFLLIWMYVGSFFLIAILLESKGDKSEFIKINLKNIIEYIKFVVLFVISVLFNFVSKTVLYIQIALIGLMVVAILASYVNANAILLLLASLLLYALIVIYNTLRLSLASIIRVGESNGAIDSMKIAWKRTSGYSVLMVLTIVVVIIAFTLLLILSEVPNVVFVIFEYFIPSLSGIASGVGLLTTAFMSIATLFVTAFLGLGIYGRILALESSSIQKRSEISVIEA